MKTLVVAPFCPYPLIFGGAIRTYHVLKMLAEFSDVTLLAYESWSEPGDDPVAHLSAFCTPQLVPGKPAETTAARARSVLSLSSYQRAVHHSPGFQRQLDALLARERFDCVVVEFTQMGYFDYSAAGDALLVLDMHNIEHELLLRRAAVQSNLLRRGALWLEGVKTRRDEKRICRSFPVVLTPSQRETEVVRSWRGGRPTHTIHNSIDAERFAMRAAAPDGNELVFVGIMRVEANHDGVRWFAQEVLPLIRAQAPDVHFTIVGNGPPPDITALDAHDHVTVTGFVPDVRPFMDRAVIHVVPLRTGGGTRLKILEGLSFGLPTVSTSVGAEGLDLVDGKEILIGDSPEQFAARVVEALSDPSLRQQLSDNGRAVVERRFTWQAVGAELRAVLEPAVANRRPAGSSR